MKEAEFELMLKSKNHMLNNGICICSVLSLLVITFPAFKLAYVSWILWVLLIFWALKYNYYKNTISDNQKKTIILAAFGSVYLCALFYINYIYFPANFSSEWKALTEITGIYNVPCLILIIGIFGILSIWILYKILTSIVQLLQKNKTLYFLPESCVTAKETALIFFIAVTAILLLSKSSPLYPLNDWVDANIFLTVGKSVYHGSILYRDIYEQKGPLLFFIFIIPAIISEKTFIGVCFLEIISAFFFLLFSYKTAKLFCKRRYILLILLPAYAFIIYSTSSFSHGGSVEEFCLPMLTCSLYFLIKSLHGDNMLLTKGESFATGIFCGCIFWIKYTMLGLYIGYFGVILFFSVTKKSFNSLLKTLLITVIGFLCVTIPILSYFVVNNAIADLWTAYFYNNIFLYSLNQDYGFLYSEISGFVYAIVENPTVYICIFLGFYALLFVDEKIFCGIFVCFVTASVVLYTRHAYMYYSFLICSFMPFGYSLFGLILENIFSYFPNPNRTKKSIVSIAALGSLTICFWSFAFSSNTYLFLKRKDDLPQYKMAAVIGSYADQSIFNYNVLDLGLYTTTGTVPNTKYFCAFNVALPEMTDDQNEYIKEGKTNFIVTKDQKLYSSNYYLIDEESYYMEGSIREYYLYKRK